MAGKMEVKVKSLKKALDVLNCFIEKQPLGVTEISGLLELNKSNVFDILSTLAAMDYISKDEATGKYYLGYASVRLGRAVGDRFSFQKLAAAHIQQISETAGEIVYLTAPMGRQIYYLDVAYPTSGCLHLFNFHNSTDPMHCTASGKAMLAFMDGSARNDYIAQPLEAMTEYSISQPELLLRELDVIKTRGYAFDRMENTLGVSCVAVPILSGEGKVLGAMSVSGPSLRFGEAREGELAALLLQHAAELKKIL